MRTLARFAVVLAASAFGCGSGTIEADADLPEDEEVASVEQALITPCDSISGIWCDGADGWSSGSGGWNNASGNGWSDGWSNGWTDGWSNAWSNAWGTGWSNGWSYAGMPTFGWTEPQGCAHPLSQVGSPLISGCNPVVTVVCNADPFCCNTAWDTQCVVEAARLAVPQGTYMGCYADSSTRALPNFLGVGMTVEGCVSLAQSKGYTYAGLQNGGECWAGNSLGHTQVSGTECNMACTADPFETCGGFWRNSIWQVPVSHPVTVQGGPLSSNHSACAAAVIAADSYCGSTYWDGYCVRAAGQMCVERFVTRPRLEDDRNVVDACIEAKLPGYPACPIAGSGPIGRECCRRGLVLNGVYEKLPYTSGNGIEVQWTSSKVTNTALGSSQTIRATVVPDPCADDFFGNPSCNDNVHHLWQAAGPGRPIYPDCSGTGGARPCNNTSFPDQMREFGITDIGPVPYRGILLATMSSLLTTTGHWELPIRCNNPTGCSTLPYDPQSGAYLFEAAWTWSGTSPMIGEPACVVSNGSGGRMGALVANVPLCNTSNNAPAPWPGNYIATFFGIN